MIDGIKAMSRGISQRRGQTIIINKVFIVVTCWRALFQHSFRALMFPFSSSHCLWTFALPLNVDKMICFFKLGGCSKGKNGDGWWGKTW